NRFVDEVLVSLRSDSRKPNPQVSEDWDERFTAYVHGYWTAPIKSPLNGKVYRTAQAYIDHVRQTSAAWCGDKGAEMKSAARRASSERSKENLEGVTVEWEVWDPDDNAEDR